MYLSEEPCLQSDIRNDLPLSIWIDIGRLRRIIINSRFPFKLFVKNIND